MKRLILTLLGSLLVTLAQAAKPLLTPQELQQQLSNAGLRVIDIRDAQAYGADHLPGAVNAPYGQWRGPTSDPGQVPPLPKLTALVQSLGLTPDTHAVVVSSGADATDFGAAARVYWTLKVLGLKDLSILNGGIKAWTDAKLPLSNAAVSVPASAFQPRIDTTQYATTQDVLAHVKAHDAVLIDARPADFFLGEKRAPAAKVPGTLPNAVNVQFDKWFAPGSASFVTPEKAREVAASNRIDPNQETISFCNTGHWAATNWFAMSEVLGYKNVKLYAGSMVEWTQNPESLPMANVPNRGQQLLMEAKLWANKTFN